MPKNDMEQKLKSRGSGRRTSGWRARNDFTRIPPMECETMLAFLPPDASYILSSFALNFSMCSASLHTHLKHIRKTYNYIHKTEQLWNKRYALVQHLWPLLITIDVDVKDFLSNFFWEKNPLQSCHVSFLHCLRPTWIPCGYNIHSGTT